MKVDVPDLTGGECGGIAITAAEGGIGHWAQIEEYKPSRWTTEYTREDPRYPSENTDVADDFVFYTLHALEYDGGPYEEEGHDVTPALIRRGFEGLMKAPADNFGWQVQRLLALDREDWLGEIDADAADVIVQTGVFGEVRYS